MEGVARSSFRYFVFESELKSLVPLYFLLALISEVVDLKRPLTDKTMIGFATWLVGASEVAGIYSLKVSS